MSAVCACLEHSAVGLGTGKIPIIITSNIEVFFCLLVNVL